MTEDGISNKVIGCGIYVHKALGPGLLESAYKECLFFKLVQSGLYVEKEKPMPLIFEDVRLDAGYRIDLLIKNKLIIEIKSVEELTDVHLAQTLTYLKLGNFKLGLLMNFNVLRLKDGIKRVINSPLCPLRKTFAPFAVKLPLAQSALHIVIIHACRL
jgi:GxxExxY protein